MKIISFATMKGGTGKTTCCFNIAGKLALQGYSVLVIDCDAQCNISSNFCFDIFDSEAYTVADILEDIDTDPLDVLLVSPIEEIEKLDLFPSTMFLFGTEVNLFSRPGRELLLKRYIQKHKDFFDQYDYILLDTGPNMGVVNQNAFLVSDSIVLITDPDCNSAKGADVFVSLWDNIRKDLDLEPTNVKALIINNVERTKMTNKLKDYISSHEMFSKIMITASIPHSTRFKEATEQNVPIHLLNVKTKQERISKLKAQESIELLYEELKERDIL